MARKYATPQDKYRADLERRNAKAVAMGFTSRAQYRRAMEKGKVPALRPQQVRKPAVKAAQERLSGSAVPKGPVRTFAEYEREYSRDRAGACRDWANLHAMTTVAQYGYTDSDKKWKKGEPWVRKNNATNKRKEKWIEQNGIDAYTDAYYRAFVDGEERYAKNRYNGGSDAMRLWYVVITGYMTPEEFESRYGAHNGTK